MPIEIEAKMRLADPADARKRLAKLGARQGSTVHETNRFFDTRDGALRAADRGLRLRVARDLDTDGQSATLTYKGPREAGQLKQREEIELPVDAPTAAAELLQRLGFTQIFSFEKRRQSWQLDDCHVLLDHLPYLGDYMEIEGPSPQAVEAVRRKLGMQDVPLIHSHYVALLVEHLTDRNLPTDRAHFDNAT